MNDGNGTTDRSARLRYAAYGSNLHPDRLRARVASARLEGTAFVADFALCFDKRGVDGSGKASITDGGSGVHIAVYSLDAADKAELDRYEHINIGYHDRTIDVPGFGECFSYTATDAYAVKGLEPYCWYHALVVAGAVAHGFPAEYIEGLKVVRHVVDPDPDRRRRNWALVESLKSF